MKRWLLITPYDREHGHDTLTSALAEVTEWYGSPDDGGRSYDAIDLADWQLYRLTKIDIAHELQP